MDLFRILFRLEPPKQKLVHHQRSSKCKDCTYPIVVGIGGATRSGKSTLAKQFYSNYKEQSDMITQDYFFKKDKPLHEKTQYDNWEIPESIDWRRFEKAIDDRTNDLKIPCESCKCKCDSSNIPSQRKYLFVEGFLLMQEHMLEYFDFLIFLNVTRDTCYHRRMNTTRVPEDYFSEILWPSYMEHSKFIVTYICNQHKRELQNSNNNSDSVQNGTEVKHILVLDGESAKEDIFEKAKKYVMEGKQVESSYECVVNVFSEYVKSNKLC